MFEIVSEVDASALSAEEEEGVPFFHGILDERKATEDDIGNASGLGEGADGSEAALRAPDTDSATLGE